MDIRHSICMENSVNATIGGEGKFFSLRALKSMNSIEIIQARETLATFHVNPS